MAIDFEFVTWVSVLLGTRMISCHVVGRAWDLQTNRARFAGIRNKGMRFGKNSCKFWSTSTAGVCSWACVRVDLQRRGVESGFCSQVNSSLASTAYRQHRRLASRLPLAGRIKEMQTHELQCTQSYDENHHFEIAFGFGSKHEAVIVTGHGLPPISPDRAHVQWGPCEEFECNIPAMCRPEVWNHEAFTITELSIKQKAFNLAVTPPISSASNQGTALAAEKLCANQAFRLGHSRAQFDRSLKEKEGFFRHPSCTAWTRASSL